MNADNNLIYLFSIKLMDYIEFFLIGLFLSVFIGVHLRLSAVKNYD
jgi:hypothetical protein